MSTNYTPQRTLQDYKLEKIDVLEELCIFLSTSEMAHIMGLKSEIEVDQYAHTLIMREL